MRIAFLAFHGTLHTRRWVAWFAERGHEVVVVTCGDLAAVEEFGKYEVHDVGPPPLGKVGYVLRLPAVRRLVRSLDVDLVHAHQATSYGLLAWRSGFQPYVITAHGSDILMSPRNPLLRVLLRRALRNADLVTVPSEQMSAVVRELAGPESPVLTMQYGVETQRLAAVAERVRVASRRDESRVLRVVSARPLFPLYRYDALVAAVGLLRDRGVAITCDLFDDGPEREALGAQIASLGLEEAIQLHGIRPEETVMEELARCDVYVSLASSDGASIALLEAMALGAVPVLADIEANRAWVEDGRNGVLTAADAASVADALERAGQLDRERVAAENLEIVRARADRDSNLGRLEQELQKLVSGR